MTSVRAGTPVKSGYYFSLERWTLTAVDRDGTALDGERGERFVPVPLAVAVLLAPALGAAFLVFMPFIGFYLMAQAALRPFAGLFRRSTAELAATMSPGLQAAGQAHLTGRRGDEKPRGRAVAALDALELEIAARRAARLTPRG